ncbi:hypothetical protein ASPVEDRAFT_78310 [Aspergillus versicolor CBS 583.65]|uniref:DUF4267 domain-containing protein n=1 Tax=Aspergillus versicolor CBS 583.65 TaxID=1036611 RepID=A0A1L9P522_ASPVE|nr:uncharacterized protein ASPVEDRAFT_78310 [Aspergillus versicolor CBS 583.65]OJI96544.1 hypothetical protein ASPVEDRAFT_78310 [Aspergillus versicolor CBS 583.65]
MSAFNPLPAYAFGAVLLGIGAHSFLRPTKEYERFGIPRHPSPLIYVKAIRESTYGLAAIALQYQGHDDALTTVVAVTSLAGLADGFLIRAHGGPLKSKAFGHWAFFVITAGWAWWRASFS